HEKTCVVCGGKVSEPCVYGEAVTSLPTQTEPGMVKRTCEVCGFEEVIETAAPEGSREASSLMGDVDKSGVVDTADARAVLRAAIAYSPLSAECITRADLDEDGSVTASDARITLRISIGLEPERRHQISYELLTEPTCTEKGSVMWSCAYCGFSETLTVPENGHRWTGPTASSARRCEVCGLMFTGWQTLDGSAIYYNEDGSVTAGRSLLYTQYQGRTAWWYLDNGVPDPAYRGTITFNGADWIITDGTAYQVSTEADRTLFRAFGEVAKATTPDMTKAEKLRACFLYCKQAYSECRPRTPHYTGIDWPIIYANDMFVNGTGNCCSYAAAFAYLAKAIGYEDVYCCNSGGHGWAEIDGNVFDPEWSKKDGLGAVTYYDLSYWTRTDVRYREAISAMLPWMHVKI
ncbi:MAG: dockerin type I repeat-containing protein, partial [Clostridia bacterium]|nr:dockerin type I repeat-containing protein [Clostridia bacterium]